jgi:hypothetical protein
MQHSDLSNDEFPRIRAFRADSKDIERASWPGNSPPAATGDQKQGKASIPQTAHMASHDSTVEPHSRRASFGVQAGALWRKNAAYQRRNIGSNVCLLCAPILMCLLLLVIQTAIGKLLLKGEQYEVSCCGLKPQQPCSCSSDDKSSRYANSRLW